MALAGILSRYRNELICDLAETYNIYDYRSLPARSVAVLAAGLRANSRVKMKMNGMKIPIDTYLLAGAFDRLSFLVWAQSTDAQKGLNRPMQVLPQLLGEEDIEQKPQTFSSGSDFDTAWKQATKGER